MFASSRFGRIIRPDLVTTIRRFPVPAAAALAAMIVLILRIGEVLPRESNLDDEIVFGAFTAFATGAAGRIWFEARSRPVEIVLSQVMAVVLGLLAGLAWSSLWLTPVMLIAALTLVIVAAPGMSPEGTPIRFWTFNTRSAFALIVGALGAGLFVIGLWAILATLRSLFDLQISHRLVSYAGTVGFTLVLPIYWLSLQPMVLEIDDAEPQPDILLRAVAALTDFIFIPLLAIYAVILLIYAAKIAVSAAMPRGQIGWMVSVFLGLGYLTFLLALPKQSPLPRVRQLFRSAWPPATLVPAGMLGLALHERVSDYGITEDRYLIGIVALATVLLFAVWVARRRLDVRAVPVIAAGLLLIGAIGPFAARSMTVHSQAQRFVNILEASGELTNGRFDGERSTPWSSATQNDLRSIILLLDRRKALHLIAPTIGGDGGGSAEVLTARLGLNAKPAPAQPAALSYARIEDIVLTNNFAWVSSSLASGHPILFRVSGQPEYTVKIEGRHVVLSGQEGAFTFDLSAEPEHRKSPADPAPRLVRSDNSQAVLVFSDLRWKGSGEARAIDYLNGQLLLRSASKLQ